MANVYLDSVSKRFPDGTLAVNRVTLKVEDRQFLVLVGPSGCGKSTTLRLIAGLETSSEGSILIGEREVSRVPPRDRDIAMVFQNYALYPHMSVYRNMSFGLTLRHFGGFFGSGVFGRGLRKIFQPRRAAADRQLRVEIDTKVRQTAERLGITHLLDRKPHQLSGGERQRVALGRAIVRDPAAFLFDEPLSNLDAKLRQQLRVELKRLHRELNATMIYVTHDQVEAMTLGDQVAVMNEGKVLQIGKPLDVYRQPANLFVARFIGAIPINLAKGAVRIVENEIWFDGPVAMRWTAEDSTFGARREKLASGSRNLTIGFRPEEIRLVESGGQVGQVTDVEQLGDSITIRFQLLTGKVEERGRLGNESGESATELVARMPAEASLQVGQRVNLEFNRDRVLWFDSETGENILREQE